MSLSHSFCVFMCVHFLIIGAIKEVREIPGKKKSQRLVEFFDIRDAGKALKEMNGKEIEGKSIAIEFSKQSGYYGRRFFHSTNPNPNAYISNKPLHFNYPPPPPPSPRRRFGPPQFSHKNFGPGSMTSNSLNGDENHFSPRRNFGREFIGERPWNWKGKQPYKNEIRYIIKEDAIVESDSRTTLMIKNIPNKYRYVFLFNLMKNKKHTSAVCYINIIF